MGGCYSVMRAQPSIVEHVEYCTNLNILYQVSEQKPTDFNRPVLDNLIFYYIYCVSKHALSLLYCITTSLQLLSVDQFAKTSDTYLFKELIYQFWKI